MEIILIYHHQQLVADLLLLLRNLRLRDKRLFFHGPTTFNDWMGLPRRVITT